MPGIDGDVVTEVTVRVPQARAATTPSRARTLVVDLIVPEKVLGRDGAHCASH